MTPLISRMRWVALIMAMIWVARDARSQDSEPAGPGLYFDVVYWGTWMDRPLKFKSGKDLKVIPLQAGHATAYVYRGPSPMIFYREEAADPVTNELKPVPVLAVPFDPNMKRAILLIVPNPAVKDALKASLMPLTEKEFPAGTALLMNGAASALKTKLGDTAFTLAPKERRLVRMPVKKSHLMAAAEWKGNWQVMHTDTFAPVVGERRLIFFYTPEKTDNVTTFVSVIPPDSMRFDLEGKPRESLSADPDFKPSENPTGMGKYIPEP